MHVYDFPTVRPVTVIARTVGFARVTERVTPPFDDVHPAVNPVTFGFNAICFCVIVVEIF
mgnify:CR=1 FL=1